MRSINHQVFVEDTPSSLASPLRSAGQQHRTQLRRAPGAVVLQLLRGWMG